MLCIDLDIHGELCLLYQVDYRQECEYARRFRLLYHEEGDPEARRESIREGGRRERAGSPGEGKRDVRIQVPRVHPQYCTQKVLVMEWVEGFRFTDKEELRKGDVDIQQLLAAGVKGSVEQLLHHGLMHVDPHPGNLLVNRSGAWFRDAKEFGICVEFFHRIRRGIVLKVSYQNQACQ